MSLTLCSQTTAGIVHFEQTSFLQTLDKDTNHSYSPKNQLLPPIFSHAGGFYISSFNLIINSLNTNDTIFYTTDGSEPDRNAPFYTSPLPVQSRSGDTNILSVIPTNFVTSGDWAFSPPTTEVFKATTIRARCFSGNQTPSDIITHTYFVDSLIGTRYNIPIVSLVGKAEDFFSDSSGIYVPGDSYTGSNNTGNYFGTGVQWERRISIEYFSPQGQKLYDAPASVRIHGGDTRLIPQKALRLYADTFFTYPFFAEKNINAYKTLLLRNSGNDNTSTMFRDMLMSLLTATASRNVDYLSGTPVVVFLNGEYWGIHNLRERIDKYYIGSNGPANSNQIDYLEKHGIVKEGDNIHYFEWFNFLETSDLTQASAYNYLKGMIDMQNFTDYNILQLYFANIDWPGNNRDFWRPRQAGGLWQWIVFDTDFGFGLESYSNYDNNTLEFATNPNGPTSPPSWNTNPPWATLQLRKLLQNETFRNDFVNRLADMLNTELGSQRVVSRIDSLEALYNYTMPEHINRWNKPQDMNTWLDNIAHLKTFAVNRPPYLRSHIMNYFNATEPLAQNITDTSYITVQVQDSMMGYIIVSTIRPSGYPWSGLYFHDVPVPIRAVPKTGYRFKNWSGSGITDADTWVYLNGDTTLTAVFETDPAYSPKPLFINELMASNTSTITDPWGEYEDWIEIFNPTPYPVDLGGYFISDNPLQPNKFRFDTSTTATIIPPYGHLLLWADDMPTQGPLHLNFKLSVSGEAVCLYDTLLVLIDSVQFGPQADNISYGRYPDGYSNWRTFGTPTPGTSNSVTSVSIYQAHKENFFYPNPATHTIYFSEKITSAEIYNVTGIKLIEKFDCQSIHVAHLKPGIYLLRVNKHKIFRLIIV